jgi:RNA polymerase sigma-70 factor (ECF subfamily)
VDVFLCDEKSKDENDADEITVNVFSKVLSKLDMFDPHFQFKTWILTIAQNTIIDFWRKKPRKSRSYRKSDEVKNQYAKSPEELMISEEEQKKIIKTIESLDANYQDIIKLRFFEESIKEIAEELGISVANTKVRVMRAKKVLAELLKNNEFEDN